MTASLRIAVADDEPDMRDYFQRVLPRLGHQVVGVACNGQELLELFRTTQPDLVITDIKMPELDGIDAANQMYREHPVAVLLVSAHNEPELVERAVADHVLGYLVKPIKQADLGPAIALAWSRFEEMEQLRRSQEPRTQ
jgi:response regulator NasT